MWYPRFPHGPVQIQHRTNRRLLSCRRGAQLKIGRVPLDFMDGSRHLCSDTYTPSWGRNHHRKAPSTPLVPPIPSQAEARLSAVAMRQGNQALLHVGPIQLPPLAPHSTTTCALQVKESTSTASLLPPVHHSHCRHTLSPTVLKNTNLLTARFRPTTVI